VSISLKKLLLGLIIGCSALFGVARAEMPTPMDPRAMANLPIEQQIQVRQDTIKRLLAATPEERKAYMEQRHQMMSKMTLGELEDLRKQHHKQWESLTPEQKEKIKADQKAFYKSLTPEQKKILHKMHKRWKHHHGFGDGHPPGGEHGDWSKHEQGAHGQ
jgi:hypothetical protein